MSIKVLDAVVNWRDGFENNPDLTVLLSRKPNHSIYEKRPCKRETLSSEQAAVVGSRMTTPTPGWHVYWSSDSGVVSFFTWGGAPDAGFGGWKRTIQLSDGTEEEVVGGWHTGPSAAIDAGFPATVNVGWRTERASYGKNLRGLAGGMAGFLTVDLFERVVADLLPDVEVVLGDHEPTVKWKGQITKAEFQTHEHKRRDILREQLKEKYRLKSESDFEVEMNWWNRVPIDDKDQLKCRPYSALGNG